MERVSIAIVADHILSPLGNGTTENLQAVLRGDSALRRYERWHDIPEAFTASLFDWQQINQLAADAGISDSYTRFEKICILSIRQALAKTDIDPTSSRVIFVFSSTKANVELLDNAIAANYPDADVAPALTARRIAAYFGNHVIARHGVKRVHLRYFARKSLPCGCVGDGCYDHAIVCGADVQSPFIVTGFQSFKALDPDTCRPFDNDRQGLNLGEAAATLILSSVRSEELGVKWTLQAGAVCNDANHISGPSRTGEGSFRAIQKVLTGMDAEQIDAVGVHGTATRYNDEMESIALRPRRPRPHTHRRAKRLLRTHHGAAGILETIISLHALDQNIVPAVRGYSSCGTSHELNISSDSRTLSAEPRNFIKLLSGFGGCNAAIRYHKQFGVRSEKLGVHLNSKLSTLNSKEVRITANEVFIDDQAIDTDGKTGKELLRHLYTTYVGDYPKFYKMDPLSRLGFVASELLLRDEQPRLTDTDSRAVIFFNRSGSIADDTLYQATIAPDNFFPEPARFVYTLPNIVTGEIAIRNRLFSETSFYLLPDEDEEMMERICKQAFNADPACRSIIAGWVEALTADDFRATLRLYQQ